MGETFFNQVKDGTTWWKTAREVWGAVGWIFTAFRNSYIMCFRSTNMENPTTQAHQALIDFHGRWFPDEIYLSRQMASSGQERQFVIQRFEALGDSVQSVITAFFAQKQMEKPNNLTVKKFFTDHVFTLPNLQTVCVPNPEPKHAFWRSLDELKTEWTTLIEALAEERKREIEQEFKAFLTKKKEENQGYGQPQGEGEFGLQDKIAKACQEVETKLLKGETFDSLAANPGKLKECLLAYLPDEE